MRPEGGGSGRTGWKDGTHRHPRDVRGHCHSRAGLRTTRADALQRCWPWRFDCCDPTENATRLDPRSGGPSAERSRDAISDWIITRGVACRVQRGESGEWIPGSWHATSQADDSWLAPNPVGVPGRVLTKWSLADRVTYFRQLVREKRSWGWVPRAASPPVNASHGRASLPWHPSP